MTNFFRKSLIFYTGVRETLPFFFVRSSSKTTGLMNLLFSRLVCISWRQNLSNAITFSGIILTFGTFWIHHNFFEKISLNYYLPTRCVYCVENMLEYRTTRALKFGKQKLLSNKQHIKLYKH